MATKRLKRLDDSRYLSSKSCDDRCNHCIALHKRYHALYKKHLEPHRLNAHLAKLKKRTKPAWRVLGSQSVQDIVFRIEKGYYLFFTERKRGNKRIQPPTFRKARKYRSFTFTQAGWKLEGENTLVVQKVRYKFYKSRPIEGAIKTVTLLKDRMGDWFVCFSTVAEQCASTKKHAATGSSVGMDFGLKTYLTLSNEARIISPQFFKANRRAIAKANRAISRKQKGGAGPRSANRRKANVTFARLHRRVANLRSNFHWQTANELARTFDVVCVEDLNLRGMKALWGRKVSDLGFASQVSKLDYVLSKHGKRLVKVDRWFASSKICHDCGHHHQELGLRDREWTCPGCGVVHDRDLNAAKNIHREGLRLLSDERVRMLTREGESVRRFARTA